MYSVTACENVAAISSNTKVLVFRLDASEHRLLDIPTEIYRPVKPVPDTSSSKESSAKEKSGTSDVSTTDSILCMTFSSCGKWLALCLSSKHLVVWRTSDWSIISNRSMPRAASSVVFTPDGIHIIVADKSGDAFLFSAINWNQEGSLLLGHLSMLLDVLISDDGKYVLTCDRDEKIRVSHFPNAYNIASYCLGHEEFVTSLCLLPHDSSILVSCSGDGTLRFWNFLLGSLCKTHFCVSDVSTNLIKTHGREGCENYIPLMNVSCYKLDASTSVACTIPDSYNGCLLYKISSTDTNFNCVNLSVCLMQVISFKTEPCAISFSGSGVLVVVTTGDQHPVLTYSFDEESGLFSTEKCSPELSELVLSINNFPNFFVTSPGAPSTVSQLFKRKFDNVQLYHERKKARLSGNTSSAAL